MYGNDHVELQMEVIYSTNCCRFGVTSSSTTPRILLGVQNETLGLKFTRVLVRDIP